MKLREVLTARRADMLLDGQVEVRGAGLAPNKARR